MEYVSSLDIIKNQIVKVDKSGINNEEAHSKIIRISLLTPNLGEAVNNIDDLYTGELAWFSESSEEIINENEYKIIYKNRNLKPWKLILKR